MPAAGMTDATRSEPANALDRDALADERTLLANERTFSAWTRTALAVTGIALGLHAMFGSVHPTWVAKALATVFIALGVALMLVAERRARAVLARLSNRQVNTIGSMDTRSITIVYTIAAASLAATLWALD